MKNLNAIQSLQKSIINIFFLAIKKRYRLRPLRFVFPTIKGLSIERNGILVFLGKLKKHSLMSCKIIQ